MSYQVGFVPSAARTISGNSGVLTLQRAASALNVLLFCTAVSGTTPNLTEWSTDGTNFATVDTTADAFAAITAAANRVKSFPVKGSFARLVWVITGTTPSFTFSCDVGSIDQPERALNAAYG